MPLQIGRQKLSVFSVLARKTQGTSFCQDGDMCIRCRFRAFYSESFQKPPYLLQNFKENQHEYRLWTKAKPFMR